MRNHLVHIISIITLSHKAKLPKMITWKRKEQININKYKNRIKRDELYHIENIVKISDSRDIYIPLNEIDYALSDTMDASKSKNDFVFWVSLLFEIERRNVNTLCASRNVPNIPDKCKQDICWSIWQIRFINLEKRRIGENIKNALISLYKLFRTDYQRTKRRTRIPYILHAGILLIGSIPPIDFSLPVNPNINAVLTATMNCNQIYQDIYLQHLKNSIINIHDKTLPNKQILYLPILTK